MLAVAALRPRPWFTEPQSASNTDVSGAPGPYCRCMTDKIVVGFDDTPPSWDALALARLLAEGTGAELLLAYVYPYEPILSSEHERQERQAALRVLEDGKETLANTPVEVGSRPLAASSPARGLHELAASEHAGALIVGSSTRAALSRVLPGSVGERVIHGAPCPVVIAPRGYADRVPTELGEVAVAFDDQPEAWTALWHAALIAARSGATLRIILALAPLRAAYVAMGNEEYARLEEERRRNGAAALERAAASVSDRVQAETSLVSGPPAIALVDGTAGRSDLLVTGSRNYGAMRQLLLGGVSTELVRSAGCPVLVVPRSVEFSPSAGAMAGADPLVDHAR
jgi:nucleotide-binding universal stress UspA family protein